MKMSDSANRNAPDPGEGFRLVDHEKDLPHPDAQIWLPGSKRWDDRLTPNNPWVGGAFYRVPDPEPVPLRWPDIPVSDDAWFQQPEPDRDVDVAAWVLSAVMAVVLLLTGFIIGWSWGG
jgi:hypothetical protein